MKRRNSSTLAVRPPLRDISAGPLPLPRSIPVFKVGQVATWAEMGALPQQSRQKSTEQLIQQFLVPKYVSVDSQSPSVSKTKKCSHLRTLQIDLFVKSEQMDDDESCFDALETLDEPYIFGDREMHTRASGVTRRVEVPENYTLAHVAVLTR